MHTQVCDQLGIEFPIFAFTHCRDVVVAVSKAGGFGVLGAVGFTPEQLEIELKWIDEHIGGKPYGVDIVIPGKYEGMEEMDAGKLETMLLASIPAEHREHAERILSEHGVPKLPEGDRPIGQLLGWTEATAKPQLEVALQHPGVKLIANALGTPPPDIMDEIHARGHRYASKAKRVMFNPIGQIVGRLNQVQPVRQVMQELVQEYVEAAERLSKLTGLV